MPIIKGIRTGRIVTVKQSQWDSMVRTNAHVNFILVERDDTTEIPQESQRASYASLKKLGDQAFEDKSYDDALQYYTDAREIKNTKYVVGKIATIVDIINS